MTRRKSVHLGFFLKSTEAQRALSALAKNKIGAKITEATQSLLVRTANGKASCVERRGWVISVQADDARRAEQILSRFS